jgi:hypothetical protein
LLLLKQTRSVAQHSIGAILSLRITHLREKILVVVTDAGEARIRVGRPDQPDRLLWEEVMDIDGFSVRIADARILAPGTTQTLAGAEVEAGRVRSVAMMKADMPVEIVDPKRRRYVAPLRIALPPYVPCAER